MNFTGRHSRLFYFVILLTLTVLAGSACKSKKKMAAQRAQEAKVSNTETAKRELTLLLSDDDDRSLVDRERALARIKAMNLDDPEIQAMIAKVEEKFEEEREAERIRAAEEASGNRGSTDVSSQLNQYLGNIAQAPNTVEADSQISEALQLFNSPDALVLIIISRTGNLKDYDKPTTIRKYLEYVKDQKVNSNSIDNLVFDSQGKIKEMELIKK